MAIISLIAAVDESNGLGKNNKLLCHLPADLKHFKKLTLGKPIIMGRNTYNSIGKPLPGRTNIVLSTTKSTIADIKLTNSLDMAIKIAAAESAEIMIIGGASVYEQALPLANRIYLTQIHHKFDADVFFPQLDSSLWHCKEKHFQASDEKNSYDMTFCLYEHVGK